MEGERERARERGEGREIEIEREIVFERKGDNDGHMDRERGTPSSNKGTQRNIDNSRKSNESNISSK